MSVCERLTRARLRSGYTTDDVASLLATDSLKVIEWESGVRQPSELILERLAEIYDTSLLWLVSGEGSSGGASDTLKLLRADLERAASGKEKRATRKKATR